MHGIFFWCKRPLLQNTFFSVHLTFFFLELDLVLIQCECFISLPHGWKISLFPILHTGVCDIPLSHDLSDVTAVLHILVSGGIKIPFLKVSAKNPDQ